MSNNIIGYFLAKSGCDKNIQVLVEIEIPPDAKTDITPFSLKIRTVLK